MKTFAEALRIEREKVGRSYRELSRGVSVPEATVRAWEQGTLSPTRAEWGRLCLQLRVMRRFPPPFAKREEVVADLSDMGSMEKAVRPSDGPPAPAPAWSSFAAALRACREAEQFSPAALGELLGVADFAVRRWESGGGMVEEHYEALCGLFPQLCDVPVPKDLVRAFAKPVGRTPSRPEPAKDEASMTKDEEAMRRVVMVLGELFGGPWRLSVSFSTEVDKSVCVVAESASLARQPPKGEGKDLPEALTRLMMPLRDEIERRAQSLADMRKLLGSGA